MLTAPTNTTPSPWPHRLATVLVCAVFPLIWVGGLVTSSEAGMAVPDWPNTYGYNLFLYPWQTWFFGPWDIFVEHGHRLLGAVVGMLTIVVAWSLWKHESRRWVVQLGFAALLLVISQGVLGGMRVVLNKQLLAMIHGCVGPLFFAVCVALWQFTSRRYPAVPAGDSSNFSVRATKLYRLALITSALAYVQIGFGAAVRHLPHMPDSAKPETFQVAVLMHLFMAAVLAIHVLSISLRGMAAPVAADRPSLRRPSFLLLFAFLTQVALGAGAWVVNYGLPDWVRSAASAPEYVVRTQSFAQIAISTAHVAVGSLILVTSLVLTLRAASWRSAASAGSVRSGALVAFGGLFLKGAAG